MCWISNRNNGTWSIGYDNLTPNQLVFAIKLSATMTFDRNHFWSELLKRSFQKKNSHHWNQSTCSKIMSFERENSVWNGSSFYTYREHWRSYTMMKNSLASKFDSMRSMYHQMICFTWLNWILIWYLSKNVHFCANTCIRVLTVLLKTSTEYDPQQ